MRILHTADWHFGRSLEGRSRMLEHEAFVDELCAIVQSESIDLVLIAGDIFDSSNPPAAAEGLYCDALERLSNGGRRAVVVIAGNHDSPDRLCAIRPLAERHGITLFGYPSDNPGILGSDTGQVRRIATGEGWAELVVPGLDHSAVVLALPYPSEARLNEILTQTVGEAELQVAYSARVGRWFSDRVGLYRPDVVRLAASHIYVTGGVESTESERPIQMGGACTVDGHALPTGAHYVALGHLHRPQVVKSAPSAARYSGSPLAFSFSEAGQAKSVTVIDASPGLENPEVRQILLSSGRPLVRWVAHGGLVELQHWVDRGRDAGAWIDIEVQLTEALSMDQTQQLRRLMAGIIHIRPIYSAAEAEVSATLERQTQSLEEQFTRFFVQKNGGVTPSPELVRLFLDLANESGDAEVEE